MKIIKAGYEILTAISESGCRQVTGQISMPAGIIFNIGKHIKRDRH